MLSYLYTINPAWRTAKEFETPGQLEPQLGDNMGIDGKYGKSQVINWQAENQTKVPTSDMLAS